jgi:hypothetical protein
MARSQTPRPRKEASVSLRITRAEYNAWDDKATSQAMLLSTWMGKQLEKPLISKPDAKQLISPEFVYNFRTSTHTRQWLKFESLANSISVSNYIRIRCNEGVNNAAND